LTQAPAIGAPSAVTTPEIVAGRLNAPAGAGATTSMTRVVARMTPARWRSRKVRAMCLIDLLPVNESGSL
jgi:hypothetical protein